MKWTCALHFAPEDLLFPSPALTVVLPTLPELCAGRLTSVLCFFCCFLDFAAPWLPSSLCEISSASASSSLVRELSELDLRKRERDVPETFFLAALDGGGNVRLRHLTGAKALEEAGPCSNNVVLFPIFPRAHVCAVSNTAAYRLCKSP